MADLKSTLERAFPNQSERTPTILIVEDEILIRIAIANYLQDCGFKVLGVSSGDEAILMLRESGVEIDLVFSDVQMPGATDGFALAQWIRASHPGLPIILTSGDTKKAATAKELCENEPFMSKPYDLDLVVAAIRARLGAAKLST
jgi:CheY-like chemotaxis protein